MELGSVTAHPHTSTMFGASRRLVYERMWIRSVVGVVHGNRLRLGFSSRRAPLGIYFRADTNQDQSVVFGGHIHTCRGDMHIHT